MQVEMQVNLQESVNWLIVSAIKLLYETKKPEINRALMCIVYKKNSE